MRTEESDKRFAGSIPDLYERYLVPLIFEPYAIDLVDRLPRRGVDRVLEIAAGTGVVTRELAARLPELAAVVATDLNRPMLDTARARGTARTVAWCQADAMRLPFPDATFDAVLCQFGAMFFPDKAQAFAEARRVLAPGGVFLFNVWDTIESNPFADVVTQALAGLFPDDPPRFMARVPHGYARPEAIRADLATAGFSVPPELHTVVARSRAESPHSVAIAYCQGTPLRNEINARNPAALNEATELATAAIAARFGEGAVEASIQAQVVHVTR